MSAILVAPGTVLRASDSITVTREDGTPLVVTLDVLRAFILSGSVAVPAPASVESEDGTIINTVGPHLTDAAGNTYVINAARQVVTNGAPEAVTANVVAIAYHLKRFWQKNAAGNWYTRNDLKSPYVQVQSASR